MPLTVVAAVGLLVVVSTFFSASEIPVFSLEDHRLGSLAAEPGGDTLAAIRADPHRRLVTILVGNNFVNVAIASLTTALFVDRIGGTAGVVLSTLFASTVVLVFGEIVPKSYGVANPERVALRVARPLRTLQVVLSPVVAIFETVSSAINRLTGGSRDLERPYVTREEIVGEIFDVGEEAAVVAISPTTATVRGNAATVAVNDELDTHLPTGGETVAGLLAEELGRPPEPGDGVDVADAQLTVRTVTDNRVRRVHVERTPERELSDEK